MPPDDTGFLTRLLQLEPTGTDTFVSRLHERNAGGELFGGQYLGQALWAALATASGREPHALTGWFLRRADAESPLSYQVERVRDGRHFGHRRVQATQGGRVVFTMDVSLRDPQLGPSHQMPMPQAPQPNACGTLADLLRQHGAATLGRMAEAQIGHKPLVEVRPVDGRAGITEPAREPRSAAWLSLVQQPPSDPALRYAMLAYLSDYWINIPCRLLHCQALFGGELTTLSLNHSLWFHHAPDIDGHLLYSIDSPCTLSGTGINRGLLHHHGGALLATVAQEALVLRRNDPSPRAGGIDTPQSQ